MLGLGKEWLEVNNVTRKYNDELKTNYTSKMHKPIAGCPLQCLEPLTLRC
jgi:hypothetical protein